MPLSICCVFQSFHVCGTDWCSHYFSDFLGFYGTCHRNRTDSESLRRQTLPLFLQQLDGQIWCATLGKASFAQRLWVAFLRNSNGNDLEIPRDLGSMSFAEVWGCLYVMICHVSHLSFFSIWILWIWGISWQYKSSEWRWQFHHLLRLDHPQRSQSPGHGGHGGHGHNSAHNALAMSWISADRSRSQQDVSVTQCSPE